MKSTLTLLQEGNTNSFKHLYDEHHNKLYFFVFRHTQSEYIAEETVQLCFIKLWEKRTSLSVEVDISAQIFRIAKSIMIDLLRKETVRKNHVLLFEKEATNFEDEFDPAATDELHKIYDGIEKMPPVRKKVFQLSRFQGLSHKKIAAQLSISPKTVENHVARAIKQLKEMVTSVFFF